MKYFVVLTLLFLISCGNPNKGVETNAKLSDLKFELDSVKIGNKIFSIDSISRIDFEKLDATKFDRDEERNLLKDSAGVKRIGDSLFFKISNGRTATLVNTKGENYGSYLYLGKLNDIGQYLIQGSFDEWSSNYLISEVTGDTTEMCGLPVVSPDRKLLISGNADLIAGFSINGFDLFEIENKSLRKAGRRELSDWGPEEIKWVNENEILAKIRIRLTGETKGALEETKFIELKLK